MRSALLEEYCKNTANSDSSYHACSMGNSRRFKACTCHNQWL
jgi:hypothetical protein